MAEQLSFTFEDCGPGPFYVWCTTADADLGNQSTTLIANSGPDVVLASAAERVLFTVVKPSKKYGFEIVGSAAFEAGKPGFVDRAMLRRVDAKRLVISNNGTAAVAGAAGYRARPVTSPGSQRSQSSGGLTQQMAAITDATVGTVSLRNGHPLLGWPWFAGGRPVGSGLWDRYAARAAIVTGYTGGRDGPVNAAAADALLAVTLQGVAGVYCAERADDRGSVDILFGVNGDCDDESATACALAIAARDEPVARASSALGTALLARLREYAEPALVVGRAHDPKHMNGNSFGHCWAVLLAAPGTVGGGLHLECTSPMVRAAAAASGAFSRVLDHTEYNRRLAAARERRPAGNMIVGARRFDRRYYLAPTTLTTATAQYIFPKGTANWADHLAGTETPPAIPPPATLPTTSTAVLHHSPNRADSAHTPRGYNSVPTRPVVADDGWLGIVTAPLGAPPPDTAVVVDPFNVMDFVYA